MFLNRAKRLSYTTLYDLYGLNLTTKLTKSFGKLRMTAQSLTKNVAIWKFENVTIYDLQRTIYELKHSSFNIPYWIPTLRDKILTKNIRTTNVEQRTNRDYFTTFAMTDNRQSKQ